MASRSFFLLVAFTIHLGAWRVLPAHTKHAQSTPQLSREEAEWKEIISLYDRAYEGYEQDKAASRRTFAEAARKLEGWRDRYEKDARSLRYLRLEVRLGIFYEAANRPKNARRQYERCLRHPLVSSADALFDGRPIAAVVEERLKSLNATPAPPPGDQWPRRSRRSGGGSKGDPPPPLRLYDRIP